MVSFFLHAAVFSAIILFTPVREIVLKKETKKADAASELSADRIQEISEKVSAVRMNELLRQIQDLQAVLHNMDLMKNELQKDYDTFAASTAENAKEKLVEIADEVVRDQRQALAAQEEVQEAVEKLEKRERDVLTDEALARELRTSAEALQNGAAEKVTTEQANAANALDRMQMLAAFAGFKATAALTEKVREAQIEASRMESRAHEEAIAAAQVVASASDVARRLEKDREELKKENLPKWRKGQLEKSIPQGEEKTAENVKKVAEITKVEQAGKVECAREAQERVRAAAEALAETIASDVAERTHLASAEFHDEEIVREDAARLSMTEAYRMAQTLEGRITESFKDLKATETAIRRKMSFTEAQKITDVAKAKRLEAKAEELEMKARTKAELDRQKEAQAELVREADNMVETSVQMMDEAMKIVAAGEGDFQRPDAESERVRWLEETAFAERAQTDETAERLRQLDEASDYQLALENAAAEDASAKAKDLAKMMSSAEVREEGGKGTTEGPPEPKGGDFDLVPGNILSLKPASGAAVPAAWMYVNSWYVIGPFPNPGRANLRRKFPPESTIDLNATYEGAGGRPVRWEFHQALNSRRLPQYHWEADWLHKSEVVPGNGGHDQEYTIWYAYTEIFVDEACDRWVAVGSDDRSDMWLNGIPIWGSSNKLKAWNLSEGFRRVHFEKGRNRMLLRVENGHWQVGWSVCIAVTDERREL